MSVACGICHLPNEVVERIFFHFGFGPHPGSSGSTTKHESGPELEGEKSNLLGDESGSSSNQRTGSMLEGVKLNFTVDNCGMFLLACRVLYFWWICPSVICLRARLLC